MSNQEVHFSTATEQSADDSSSLKRRSATAFPPETSTASLWEGGLLNAESRTDSADSGDSATEPVTPKPRLAVRFAVDTGESKNDGRRRSFPRVPTPHPRDFAELISRENAAAKEQGEDVPAQ